MAIGAGMRGQVKWFSSDRRYGFITDETGKDHCFLATDVIGTQVPRGGEIVEFERVDAARGWRGRKVRIIGCSATGRSRDDRDTCRHCGKKMVPRIIVLHGRLERSVCPFCGETHRHFARHSWAAIVFLAVVGLFFLGRCS